eukprot:12416325-Karenia_brevis.AAC.1
MDWNPQNDKQAVARAHRVGQTREVSNVAIPPRHRISTQSQMNLTEMRVHLNGDDDDNDDDDADG